MYFKEPINISIDIDGVLVNNFAVWKKYFDSMSKVHDHKPYVIPYGDSPKWDYFPSICKECFDFVLHDKDMIMTYEIVDEALDVLAFLKSLNFNLHIISQRPADVVGYTEQWAIEKMGLLLSSINVVEDKVATAQALNCKYHVDDAPHHILAFQKQKQVQSIIWNHPYNLGLVGPRVDTWPQYGAYLMWATH